MPNTTAQSWQNWAGNQVARPRRVVTPRSVEDVVTAVEQAASDNLDIRMAGTGHSFTPAAVTDGVLLQPGGWRGIRSVDRERGLVTAEAGTPLAEFNAELDSLGLALSNMGDIMVQTLAGALQTGTHGTGRDVGGLADLVHGLELVTADGEVLTCSADDADRSVFDAARVGLGALGIVTAVTFKVEPAFVLQAHEAPMSWPELLPRLDAIYAENEHVDWFWFPHTDGCAVKRNNRIAGPAQPVGAVRSYLDNQLLANTVFEQTCRLGARFPGVIKTVNGIAARLMSHNTYSDTSYKVFTAVRDVRFLETEWAIPREHLAAALTEIRALIDRHDWRISFPVEVRVTPPGDAWLTTSHGRDSAYIACHVYNRTPNPDYFREVEAVMCALGGRPHWGKMHTRDAAYLAGVYPRFAEFLAVRDRLDPGRRFTNDYLRQVLGD